MTSYSIRDVSVVNQLDRARKDLDALKGSQFISRRGLATVKTESQLIESQTVNVGIGTILMREIVYIKVEFRADYQVSPYGRIALEFYDSSGRLLDSDSGIVVYYLNEIVTRVDDGILQWNVDTRSSGMGTIGTQKYYCKVIVYGTDSGRITWRNVSEDF